MKHIAIYMRVSTNKQTTASQEHELRTWASTQTQPVQYYTDTATGKNFERAGWNKLETAIATGQVAKVVVWRLDRLGRTVSKLTTILDELEARGIGFLSLKDGFDANTPAGRLTRNVLASVAQFELEVRQERQLAGIQAAKSLASQGIARKTRSGRVVTTYGCEPKKGVARKLTPEVLATIRTLKGQGSNIAQIARVLSLARKTVYVALKGQASV